jgi:hypothetical protein
MKTIKFYKYATWFLLTLNVILIAFLLLGPRFFHSFQRNPFQSKAIAILHLSSEQAQEFEQLAMAHNEEVRNIAKEQANHLKSYFEKLTIESPMADSIRYEAISHDLEYKKIKATYDHFLEVKSLLRPEQLPYFNAFINEALQSIMISRDSKEPKK